MLWLVIAALTAPAQADSFRLANGSVIEGTLATYELGGNCQIFVAAGPVRGATLLLPCDEILAWARPGAEPPPVALSAAEAPAPAIVVEEVTAPPPLVVPIAPPTQAPAAVELPAEPVPAQPAAAPEPPAATQPVAASLPEGYALPGDDALADDMSAHAAAEPAAPAPPPADNLRGSPRPAPTLDDPAADPPAADAPEAATEEQAAPEGWRKKNDGGMPRWLYRAIYGEDPAPAGDDGSES